jgi:hypothetical protein
MHRSNSFKKGENVETLTPIKAIRAKCLDCCCGSTKEVKLCTKGPGAKMPCALYTYRLGRNPNIRRAYTPEERARMAFKLKNSLSAVGKIPLDATG